MNGTGGREPEAGNEDLLFSPMRNPTAPGGEMLDERNPDSVLFDVRQLGAPEQPDPSARAGTGALTPEEEASGLIDVKKVLAEPTEAEIRSPVVERLAPQSPEPSMTTPETGDRARTTLLLTSIIVLLAVAALLAAKALG